MRITVDGLDEDVPEETRILEVLRKHEEPTTHVIVELNGSFVHPNDYGSIELRDGDRLEIVYPAFGG